MPTIKVPARLENLDVAKEYLKKAIPEAFAAQTSNVLLVAEELLVNVFSYAYPEGVEGEAAVSLDVVNFDGEDKLVFKVIDWGEPFNPFEEAPVPDLTLDIDSRPVGGLGIFLIKQVSEKQTYRYIDNANSIWIVFGKTPASV
ncbi:MAG: ATP-binding protein [Duodenibacillus sp.]|nr:ATP-binding protein [Duodenibacillus sp.]